MSASPSSQLLRPQFPPHVPLPHYDTSPDSRWPSIESSLRSLLDTSPISLDLVHHTIVQLASSPDSEDKKQYSGLKPVAEDFGLDRFTSELVPFLVTQALGLPELFPVADEEEEVNQAKMLPFLVSGKSGKVVLTKEQCCALLALSFLGGFGLMYSLHDSGESFSWTRRVPKFLASSLLIHREQTQMAKARMLVEYFEKRRKGEFSGVTRVEFERIFKFPPLVFPDSEVDRFETYSPETMRSLATSFIPADTTFAPCTVIPKGSLRLAPPPSRHADFANKYLGGGVFIGGCVQEEILFAENPECCVGMLFCPRMGPNEAIIIRGTERYSGHVGYGFSLGFEPLAQVEEDEVVRGVEIVALDAVDYRAFRSAKRQFYPKDLIRDVWKSYVAFSGDLPISTGNWGCGAFLGNKNLKFVEQYIAASAAGNRFFYYAFQGRGEEALVESYQTFVDFVASEGIKVRDAYDALLRMMEVLDGMGIRVSSVLVTNVLVKMLRGEEFSGEDVKI